MPYSSSEDKRRYNRDYYRQLTMKSGDIAKLKRDIEELRIALSLAKMENERKQAIIRKFQQGRASSGDAFLREKVAKLEQRLKEERAQRRAAEAVMKDPRGSRVAAGNELQAMCSTVDADGPQQA
jgi:hypothetical protein